jgi:hypothetical protein
VPNGSRVVKRGRERERGAALVEFAIILPLLVVFIFGIIDFGFVFNDLIAVRQGARDGAREAIVTTVPTSAGGPWSCPIHVSSPPSPGTDLNDLVCFTKDRTGLAAEDTRVKIFFQPQVAPAAPFAAGQPVIVCLQYPIKSESGLFSSVLDGHAMTTKVETLIEQNSSTLTAPFAEDPITTWPSSCSDL